MAKLIDKNFLIHALNREDERLKEYKPKANYKVLETLKITLEAKTLFKSNGLVINPSLLDNQLKTKQPLTLFGLTDYFSGYQTSLKYIAPPNNSWGAASYSGIQGFNFFYSNPVDFGTMVRRFSVVIGAAYEAFIFLGTSNQIEYGSLLNNLSDANYLIESLRIQIPIANDSQWDNPLLISRMKINGKLNIDSINIRTYIQPSDFQTSIALIPLNIMLDKNLVINQYINFDCQNISYFFKLKKIK